MIDKHITRGLGPGSQSIITKAFGGLFYRLKGWVTAFKKEIVDWATKLYPTRGREREEPSVLFEATERETEFETFPRSIEFIKELFINGVERLSMAATGVFHKEITNTFEKVPPVATGVIKEEPMYGVEHLGTVREVECPVRSQVFDEAHEYFETPQL